jgi:hypothetical protein
MWANKSIPSQSDPIKTPSAHVIVIRENKKNEMWFLSLMTAGAADEDMYRDTWYSLSAPHRCSES